ncbi:hypothetical protein CY34DRAFT_264838 [Suillus luteus UH-Slu-Lm8-n1]|uniref:Uncharacterized protein n=1 Tax=Suillus luteus UH-Slu-Lm8-n1 TaxID=930992 RepID=A0A0D0BC27_9AGAM|nr:hypothetical protein CY34DRAFT_264838 [Suillus luteus UH-Slu-Lm8-n1]
MASTGFGTPLDTVAIVSLMLTSILYGFSVLMFMGTTWTFTYIQRIQDVNRPIAAVAILMFLLSTVHIVVVVIRTEDGLVKYRDTFPGGPVAFFADVSQETFVVKCAIYVLQTLLGDGVMIYRCYVVWKSVRVINLPCVMWCGVATFGVCWTYNYSQAGSNFGSIFTGETGHWVTAFLVFTLTANLLTTGLLAYRIWTIERSVAAIRSTKGKMPIIWVLVDAALLYSMALCSSLICFARSNNGLFVIGDMIVIIISIAFYMVFIRLAISKSTQDHLSTLRGGPSEVERRISVQFPTQPLQTGYLDNVFFLLATDR